VKIVFLSHYVLPHLGGIEVVIDALAREYVREGHEVSVIASSSLRAGESMKDDVPRNYRVVRVPALNTLERRLNLPYPLFEPVQLLRAIRRECANADVVHAHGVLYPASLLGLRWTRARTRAARVLTEHAGTVHYRSAALNAMERAAIATIGNMTAAAAEAIVVVGSRVADEMRRRDPRKRVVQIDNGVDGEVFRPAGAEERAQLRRELGWGDEPRVLFVGRIVERKGAPLAIEMARRNADLRLVIAGPGETKIEGTTQYCGAVSTSLLAMLYRAADAFVLPSHGEGGFPLTAREAMASGLPCVLADDPAYREALQGLSSGVMLAPPDADALAGTIRVLLAAGEPARVAVASFAAEHFRWSVVARRHLELYEELRA
jgi:glycosyltransferase involved in cell wall biosynthesis